MGRSPLTQRSLAGASIALGCVVLFGWFARQAWILQPLPHMTAMVASSALCFVIAGVALIGIGDGDPMRRLIAQLLGGVLVAMSAAIFLQNLFSIHGLFDWARLHAWLDDGNPDPGRMTPDACIGFALEGVVLLALSRGGIKRTDRTIPVLLLALSLLGIAGLAGYWLATDLVFPWMHSSMALPTAIGMLAMAAGSWEAWKQCVEPRSQQPVDRIVRASAAILIGIALVAGLAGFAMLETQAQSANARLLEQSLHARASAFDEAIQDARDDSASLATSPDLIGQMQRLPAMRGKAGDAALATALRSAVAVDFNAATITSFSGQLLAQHGIPVASPELSVPLDDAGRASLLWDKGFVLRIRTAMPAPSGEVTGYLTTERELPGLTTRLNDLAGFGKTGEILLCATDMQCFPRAPGSAVRHPSLAAKVGQPSPMTLALQGHSGTITTIDERDREVIASYAPLASARLGIAIQQDTSEIYAPIRNRMLWLVPTLAALIAFGLLLLRSKVRPLAARLAGSENANREAHDEIAAIVGGIAEGLITVDASCRILSANPAAEKMFGHAADGLIGRDFNALLPIQFRAGPADGLRRYLTDGKRQVGDHGVELIGLRSDDSQFPIELSVSAIEQSDELRYVGVVRDATARKQAGLALLFEKERLRVTLHSIADAVITTDTHGLITYMNPVAEQLSGWSSSEAVGQRSELVYAIVTAAFGSRAPSPVAFALTTGAIGGKSSDTVLVRRDGTRVEVDDSASPIRDGNGTVVGAVLVFRDATQARRLTGHINHQATHDALTDLMNRREFERQLTATLDGEGPQSQGHVLLFIDLDQFKIVNDTAGHAAGDKLLKQVSGLLKSCLRSSDLLARMGGDEFAVLLRDCPIDPGIRVAESLRQVVADIRFDWEGALFRIGASIGLVQFEAGASLTTVLSEADSACYLAKDKGRNRVYVHRAENEDVMRRSGELNWTSRIHSALAENRFLLFAQRIVPVSGSQSRDAHYELLVRMRDEQGELVPPMAFIPAAERYGLMASIDRWVVAHAFECLATAHARGASGLMFSINLSGATLGDDGFADYVEDQFRKFKVAHESICFEITETAAITNLVQAGRFIGRLKQHGCKFSLDDFGVGMSSFTYLKHLPVDFLKIDGSFIRNVVNDEIDAAMVDAINRVGHVMGIKTVAEFVEDDAILQRLRFIGIDHAQGYGIEAPRPLLSLIPLANALVGNEPVQAVKAEPASELPRIQRGSRWNAG